MAFGSASPKGNHLRTCSVVLDLFHKERGGKGVWKEIEQGNQIRVTKNVGKRVKLIIKASSHFLRANMNLRLIDISDSSSHQEGQFHLESVVIKVTSKLTQISPLGE